MWVHVIPCDVHVIPMCCACNSMWCACIVMTYTICQVKMDHFDGISYIVSEVVKLLENNIEGLFLINLLWKGTVEVHLSQNHEMALHVCYIYSVSTILLIISFSILFTSVIEFNLHAEDLWRQSNVQMLRGCVQLGGLLKKTPQEKYLTAQDVYHR